MKKKKTFTKHTFILKSVTETAFKKLLFESNDVTGIFDCGPSFTLGFESQGVDFCRFYKT